MTENAAVRRRTMQAVRSKDTKPERIVRTLAYGLGCRYRLHRTDLPGTPDLAFIGKRKVVFVHGCFWHGHDCVRGARVPKNNREYWTRKIANNRARDQSHLASVTSQGWQALVIWECGLKRLAMVRDQLDAFLKER